MTPPMRWFIVCVGASNVFLAYVLHNDPLGYTIGGLCFLVAAIA